MKLGYKLLLVAVLVGVVFLLAANQDTEPTPPKVEDKFVAVTSKEVLIKRDSGYDVRIEYPVSSNAQISEVLKTKADFWYDEFLSYPYEPSENYDYYLSVRYFVVESTDTVTYTFLNNGYTGGAHDFLDIHTFTFLKQGGRELELDEIIEASTFLNLQKLAREELVKKYVISNLLGPDGALEEGQINEGTQNIDDFERFEISNEGLTFLFPPYQIGPWSAGSHDLELSYEQLTAAGVELNPR